jgi:hypothetical protein
VESMRSPTPYSPTLLASSCSFVIHLKDSFQKMCFHTKQCCVMWQHMSFPHIGCQRELKHNAAFCFAAPHRNWTHRHWPDFSVPYVALHQTKLLTGYLETYFENINAAFCCTLPQLDPQTLAWFLCTVCCTTPKPNQAANWTFGNIFQKH